MGLLLSILVFSVGVLEVIACVRHIQYGYLPEWAPRRHVLATGTSGLTKLRDRWRKKPSRSADYDNKTKKSDYDVSRSCDVPYYRGECYDPLYGSGLSDKCGSLPEHSEDTSASNFVSTDVGEFNLRYQEFEEILPREANIFNRCDDSEICQYSEVSNRDGIDLSSRVVERGLTKGKPHPSFIDNLVSEENAIFYGQRSRSQSPSPRKSKADISWPLDVPRTPVSRRPSTPTTAEEDGGHSPYYGGEFLTEEHIRSTQRPLSVSTETYHADQDITPLLHKVDQESTRSLSRPLTVSLPDEHRKTDEVVDKSLWCNQSCVPETTSSTAADKSEQLVSSDINGISVEGTSLASHSSDPVDGSVMSTSEEEAAKELCIKQKRRTSKTEYLPPHEEVAAISRKELTPEPSFATQKEETRSLKPAKATSFEEARMETFDSGPLYADKSAVVNKEARRSSIVSSTDETDVILGLNVTERSGIDDSSALIGKLQVIAAKDQSQLEKNSTESTTGSWVTQVSSENKDSPHSEAGVKKSEGRKKQLQFDVDPDTSDIDISRSPLDKKGISVNITTSPVNINEIYDIRPTVEVTAIQTVDKIIDDAVARVTEIFSLMSSDGSYQQYDENADNERFLCDDAIDVNDVKKDLCDQTNFGPGRKLEEHTNSTLQWAPTENVSNPDGDIITTHTVRSIDNFGSDAEKVSFRKKEEDKETLLRHTERDNVADSKEETQYSKIDSTNTNALSKGTCETSETSGNLTESVPQMKQMSSSNIQDDFVSNDSTVSVTQSKNKDDVRESLSNLNIQKDVKSTVGPNKDEAQITKQDNGQSNDPVLHQSKPSEEKSELCSSPKTDLSETDKKTDVSTKDLGVIDRSDNSSAVESSGVQISKEQHQSQKKLQQSQQQQQQESSKAAPEAFWLIFSGEYTKAMSKDWHSGHFCCWQCDESLTGQRYVLRDDHPYCIKCYESVFANNCEECNRTIGIDSKDLSYKDKHWHEACFLCTKCRVSLVDKQFGSKADKIYCGNCYDAQFASRCDGCGEIFRAGTKKMEYKTRQWHEKCFCCCVCKSAIGTKSFIPREQEIYCATCYEEKFATRCVKCNKIITSGGVTYKNEPWHRECFTCTNCNTSLAGQRFTSRDEKPYCAECFGELFAKRCTSCSKPITGIGGTRFISFEDRHWHNDCFICASCKTSLVGRGFITDGDDIICPECAKQKLM